MYDTKTHKEKCDQIGGDCTQPGLFRGRGGRVGSFAPCRLEAVTRTCQVWSRHQGCCCTHTTHRKSVTQSLKATHAHTHTQDTNGHFETRVSHHKQFFGLRFGRAGQYFGRQLRRVSSVSDRQVCTCTCARACMCVRARARVCVCIRAYAHTRTRASCAWQVQVRSWPPLR